jgi:hypothetical protein
VYGGEKVQTGFQLEDLRKRKPLENLGVNWRIILKCIFSKGDEEGMDWIDLVQDRQKWQALLNAAMNLWVPQIAANFSISSGPIIVSRKTLSYIVA